MPVHGSTANSNTATAATRAAGDGALPANVIPLFGRGGDGGANQPVRSQFTARLRALPARRARSLVVTVTWRAPVAFPVDCLITTP